MKELYTNAKIELVEFNAVEVIVTSGFSGEADPISLDPIA